MNANKMESSFFSNSSSKTVAKQKSRSPQSQCHGDKQHTAPVKSEDSQWKAIDSKGTNAEELTGEDSKTRRRVAVCDATDDAKESRCHMRVIMKKF